MNPCYCCCDQHYFEGCASVNEDCRGRYAWLERQAEEQHLAAEEKRMFEWAKPERKVD